MAGVHGAVVPADAVQVQVHRAEAGRVGHEFHALDQRLLDVPLLRAVHLGPVAAVSTYSCAASRNPPVPHAGSTIDASGPGRITSTTA